MNEEQPFPNNKKENESSVSINIHSALKPKEVKALRQLNGFEDELLISSNEQRDDSPIASLQQQPANHSFYKGLRRKLKLKNGLIFGAATLVIGGCVYCKDQLLWNGSGNEEEMRRRMGTIDVPLQRPPGKPNAIGSWNPGLAGADCISTCRMRKLNCIEDRNGQTNYNPFWPGWTHQLDAMKHRFGCTLIMLPGSNKIGGYQDKHNDQICYLWPNNAGNNYARPGKCGAQYKDAIRMCWCWNLDPPTPPPVPPVPGNTLPPVPAKPLPPLPGVPRPIHHPIFSKGGW